ncbi:hypothetical protein UFOVP56_38 [uncultured Caudovirales phage]|uniref:Uncharacterized protein n=1 Tax=uncultured Caudovirales phage TaxID=2100421 RepID=A0A6J5T7Y5_9CAUD|nr:hypothetical protein UFOVP56_38 [uncultured Caudovirales phage]
MNERIRLIAEQFKMNFSADGYPQDGIHWDNVYEFAKIIVQECALVAFAKAPSDESACEVSQAIEEHFGVAE